MRGDSELPSTFVFTAKALGEVDGHELSAAGDFPKRPQLSQSRHMDIHNFLPRWGASQRVQDFRSFQAGVSLIQHARHPRRGAAYRKIIKIEALGVGDASAT